MDYFPFLFLIASTLAVRFLAGWAALRMAPIDKPAEVLLLGRETALFICTAIGRSPTEAAIKYKQGASVVMLGMFAILCLGLTGLVAFRVFTHMYYN